MTLYILAFVCGLLAHIIIEDVVSWFNHAKAVMLHEFMHKVGIPVTKPNADVIIKMADFFNYDLDKLESFLHQPNPNARDRTFIDVIKEDPQYAMRIVENSFKKRDGRGMIGSDKPNT